MNNYKLYAPLVLTIGMLMFLLNYCTTIASCAFVFTLLMLAIDCVYRVFGIKRVLQTISAYAVVNTFFLYDYQYIAGSSGVLFQYLVPVSLGSVLLASMAWVQVVSLCDNKLNFSGQVALAMVFAAGVDAFVMFVYLINYLSVPSAIVVSFKEILFKCVYILAMLLIRKVILSTGYGKSIHQTFSKIKH